MTQFERLALRRVIADADKVLKEVEHTAIVNGYPIDLDVDYKMLCGYVTNAEMDGYPVDMFFLYNQAEQLMFTIKYGKWD